MSMGTLVLVVEDKPLIHIDFADMLENFGFLVANTTAAAIAMLSEHEKIRLIMTDMDMRGRMDGSKARSSSFLVVRSREPCGRAYDN